MNIIEAIEHLEKMTLETDEKYKIKIYRNFIGIL